MQHKEQDVPFLAVNVTKIKRGQHHHLRRVTDLPTAMSVSEGRKVEREKGARSEKGPRRERETETQDIQTKQGYLRLYANVTLEKIATETTIKRICRYLRVHECV